MHLKHTPNYDIKRSSYVSTFPSCIYVCNAFLVANNALTADLCLLGETSNPRSCINAYHRVNTSSTDAHSICSASILAAASVNIDGCPEWRKVIIRLFSSILRYTQISSPHTVLSCSCKIVASASTHWPIGCDAYARNRSLTSHWSCILLSSTNKKHSITQSQFWQKQFH